jgi:hypothetical protein
MKTGTLDELLAEYRADAAVLRRYGDVQVADALLRVANDVEKAAEPYLRFISETEASIRAGKSADWIRSRYADLAREGHARKVGGARLYREVAIPRRSDVVAAREAGRAAAKRAP